MSHSQSPCCSTGRWLCAGLALGLLFGWPPLTEGQPPAEDQQHLVESQAPAAELLRGAATYRAYCRSCHGTEGRGDGPVAPDLKREPPDLTLLAKKEGGHFPADRVRRKLDGRAPVPSHGPSEMPVWGLTFSIRGERPEEVDRRIDELVELIRSLQRSTKKD